MRVFYGDIMNDKNVSEMASGDEIFVYRAEFSAVEIRDKDKEFISSVVPVFKTVEKFTIVINKAAHRIEFRDFETNDILVAVCSTKDNNVFIHQVGSETRAVISSCDFEIFK